MSAPAPAVLGGTAIKPVERKGFDACRYFCYDPTKGTVMGRTGKSWGLITAFYIVYYLCLIAFWSLMMYIFLLTINDDSPKWQTDESLIGSSPGLGLRPAQPSDTIDSSMIIFNKDSKEGSENVPGWGLWYNETRTFLNKYDPKGKARSEGKLKRCSPSNPSTADKACEFSKAHLSVCGRDNFGYDQGKPCLFFKLNKIYGLVNDPYDGTVKKDLGQAFPDDFPEELKAHVLSKGTVNKNQVWINCRGENPADLEAMGNVTYYPKSQGIPGYYFPYLKQEGYESPVVAVKFENPALGQLIHIECRAWANNIDYNRMHRVGMVHFELLVLNNTLAEAFGSG